MPLGDFHFRSIFVFFSFCKESIYTPYFPWDHLCVKEDLGYFNKDIALHSFLQGENFCNFVFSFICMIYKWGGDFIGGNFSRGQFSWGENSGGGERGGGNFHYNPAYKMVEKFGKSWVLSICPSRISHIIDYWHCSTLIYLRKIAT